MATYGHKGVRGGGLFPATLPGRGPKRASKGLGRLRFWCKVQSDPPLVQLLRKNSACKIYTHKISMGAKKPPPTLHFAPTRPRLSGEWAAKGGASPPCGEAWKLPDSGRGREPYLCGRKATAKAAIAPMAARWGRFSFWGHFSTSFPDAFRERR